MIKPMLACTTKNIKNLFDSERYLLSYKYDGIRCLAINKQAISRSGKVFRNKYIQERMNELPADIIFDGELLIGSGTDNFSNNTKGIMTINSKLPELVYIIFDIVDDESNALARYNKLVEMSDKLPSWCKIAPKTMTTQFSDYLDMYKRAISDGYEGVMIQKADGEYKHGRSTVKQRLLIKTKEIKDEECVVVGFTELTENLNESIEDDLGYKKKSTAKSNIIKKNSLGAFICEVCNSKNFEDGTRFKIGTGIGLTLKRRKEIWDNKDEYLGKIIKYKHLTVGAKDKPRNPSFIGFRDTDDM